MNYCVKGKELLQELKRAEWLPPYNENGVHSVLSEIKDIHVKFNNLVINERENYEDSTKVTIAYCHQCLSRNHLYLNCYFNHRGKKMRELWWETGPILPESVRQHILSDREKEYFANYNSLLTDYNQMIGLDLTSDIEPPKDLLIEVKILRDIDKIMTENGIVSLNKGSIHFLRRNVVEKFIRDGAAEHIQHHDH